MPIDVTLPNGKVIQGVPEGTSKEEVKRKAIKAGFAVEADFAAPPPAVAPSMANRSGMGSTIPPTPETLAGGAALARGFHRAGTGIIQAGLQGAEGLSDFLFADTPSVPGFFREQREQQTAGANVVQDALARGGEIDRLTPGQRAGMEFAGELALPGAAAVKTPRGAAAVGGLFGASQFDPTGEKTISERVQQGALGAGAAGTLQLATPTVLKALTGSARQVNEAFLRFRPKTRATLGVRPEDLAAAERAQAEFGTFFTPGEVTGNPVLLRQEASAELPAGAAQQIFKRLDDREKVLAGHTQDLLKRILPEGEVKAQAEAERLFNAAHKVPVDPAYFRAVAKENPLIKRVMREAKVGTGADPLAQGTIKQVAEAQGIDFVPGTVSELEVVRRGLKDAIKRERGRSDPNNTVVRQLEKAERNIRGVIDLWAPDHATARAISQRAIVKRNMERALETGRDTAGEPATFFQQFLATPQKRKEILDSIDNIVDAPIRESTQEKMDMLARGLKLIDRSALGQAIGREPMPAFGARGGSLGTRQTNAVIQLLTGPADRTMAEFITNPAWSAQSIPREVFNTTPGRAALILENLMTRVQAQAGGHAVSANTPEQQAAQAGQAVSSFFASQPAQGGPQ